MDPTRTSHDPATEDVASRTNMKKNRNENRGGHASMAPALKEDAILTTTDNAPSSGKFGRHGFFHYWELFHY